MFEAQRSDQIILSSSLDGIRLKLYSRQIGKLGNNQGNESAYVVGTVMKIKYAEISQQQAETDKRHINSYSLHQGSNIERTCLQLASITETNSKMCQLTKMDVACAIAL